jgi:hypothetical protein
MCSRLRRHAGGPVTPHPKAACRVALAPCQERALCSRGELVPKGQLALVSGARGQVDHEAQPVVAKTFAPQHQVTCRHGSKRRNRLVGRLSQAVRVGADGLGKPSYGPVTRKGRNLNHANLPQFPHVWGQLTRTVEVGLTCAAACGERPAGHNATGSGRNRGPLFSLSTSR